MSEIFRDSIFWVETDRIVPNPFQPRREFDEERLKELAESIRMYGLLQPITVTRREVPRDDGGLFVEYELIAGERRLRASKLAGLTQIPVIIRTAEDSNQMKLELAIIENLQREDLNPVDRARAFDRLSKEFGFKHSDIGKKVGKSREYVSNTIRLLTLPEEILTMISGGKITDGHTRPIMMLNGKPEEQMVLAREIVLKKLTVRESEAIARRVAQEKVRNQKYRFNNELLDLERQLAEHLGTRVHIEPRDVGGRLVISYFSPDDLRTILTLISERDAAGVSEAALKEAMAQQPEVTEGPVTATDPEHSPEMEDAPEDVALLDDRNREEREAAEAELYSIRNFTI